MVNARACARCHSDRQSARPNLAPGDEKGRSMTTSDENDVLGTLRAWWRQAWPVAAVAIAVLVNVLVIGALGYALTTLL
jgi:hypothetical protein